MLPNCCYIINEITCLMIFRNSGLLQTGSVPSLFTSLAKTLALSERRFRDRKVHGFSQLLQQELPIGGG